MARGMCRSRAFSTQTFRPAQAASSPALLSLSPLHPIPLRSPSSIKSTQVWSLAQEGSDRRSSRLDRPNLLPRLPNAFDANAEEDVQPLADVPAEAIGT